MNDRAQRFSQAKAAGESVESIARREGLSRARIYQILASLRGERPKLQLLLPQLALPPGRPWWSFPDAELLTEARAGRREIEAATVRS